MNIVLKRMINFVSSLSDEQKIMLFNILSEEQKLMMIFGVISLI